MNAEKITEAASFYQGAITAFIMKLFFYMPAEFVSEEIGSDFAQERAIDLAGHIFGGNVESAVLLQPPDRNIDFRFF